jgi:hypothetical protein
VAVPAPHRRAPDPGALGASAMLGRSAERKMIRARATCFWARLRSATIACKTRAILRPRPKDTRSELGQQYAAISQVRCEVVHTFGTL